MDIKKVFTTRIASLIAKPYAKQITHLEANPANCHYYPYRHRHYFWGAVVPVI